MDIWVSCCPIEYDQRDSWTDCRETFGVKFFQTWVGAHMDLNQYDILLGHAANLGLISVWLYQYQEYEPYSDDNISSFCNYAWQHGWLTRVEQQYRATYHCHYSNPCVNCDPYSTEGWDLVTNVAQGTFRRL